MNFHWLPLHLNHKYQKVQIFTAYQYQLKPSGHHPLTAMCGALIVYQITTRVQEGIFGFYWVLTSSPP